MSTALQSSLDTSALYLLHAVAVIKDRDTVPGHLLLFAQQADQVLHKVRGMVQGKEMTVEFQQLLVDAPRIKQNQWDKQKRETCWSQATRQPGPADPPQSGHDRRPKKRSAGQVGCVRKGDLGSLDGNVSPEETRKESDRELRGKGSKEKGRHTDSCSQR